MADSASPIIIKRKRVTHEDGHHGGAWKVAYADFVTAMMAFFLLMWLLNATTEDQRKGIADYFNPAIPISRISGGGADGLNGSSIFTEDSYVQMGTGATRQKIAYAPEADRQRKPDMSAEAIAQKFEDLKTSLEKDNGRLSEHLAIKLTPEGMVVELIDSDDTPLFPVGMSEPTPTLNALLDVVSNSFGSFENDIKIVGHTDSRPFRKGAAYDNWNLSADRANTARRMLIAHGVERERVREVSGKADTDPLVPEDPTAAQNRRISIVILTQQAKG